MEQHLKVRYQKVMLASYSARNNFDPSYIANRLLGICINRMTMITGPYSLFLNLNCNAYRYSDTYKHLN
uniref:Uncharacterized protein n=1 Tax=Arundo donax TaxID=35708 RepID=A0A0A9H6K7_ARUDO